MAASEVFATVPAVESGPDGRASWIRLIIAMTLSTLGGVGLWSVVVALPAVQADFGAARGAASLPYVLAMTTFGLGAIGMGRLADRFGIVLPLVIGWASLCAGYAASSLSTSLVTYALAHALIGLGSSASFAPLLADISLWFVRRRGIAVAICASGNYIAGAIWPPLVQYGVAHFGWRPTHVAIACICLVTMPALIYALRRRPNFSAAAVAAATPAFVPSRLPVGPGLLQALLIVAGIACCVAMAMPQVHIVAYCGDLGYGAARGAEMLTLMLGFGIVSRIASGFVADRIGGIATLLVGSTLQALALLLYTIFDALGHLYVISILFGLFQGGIVPSYAVIVREYFPANEAASRIAVVISATIAGMALGGWLSGVIFDLTGSYHAAFLHGLAWNLLNVGIAAYLMMSSSRREPSATAPVPA